LVFAASEPGWAGIIVAALGSSALGAIFGGWLTTWLRGRIERAEAWRTRLIQAADDFQSPMAEAFLDFKTGELNAAANGERPLHEPGGELRQEIADSIRKSREASTHAHQRLTRIQLLFGPAQGAFPDDRGPYACALNALDFLNMALALVEGKSRARMPIETVLGLRDGRTSASPTWDSLTVRRVGVLDSREGLLPDSFDPADDSSVATWALTCRDIGTEGFNAFIDACVTAIREHQPGRYQSRGYEAGALTRWRRRGKTLGPGGV
jgi:hypothetical protein